MVHWFKRLFASAEVDGITFYSYRGLAKYLDDRKRHAEDERKEKHGYRRYRFLGFGSSEYSRAVSILQEQGVTDWELHGRASWHWSIDYWAKRPVVTRTGEKR